MVEVLGAAHQDDCCDAGCRQEHAFHFVRVRAGVDLARRRHGAAIDLKLDLHPRLRASRPETLMCMTPVGAGGAVEHLARGQAEFML